MRLNYPELELDGDVMMPLLQKISAGEAIPDVEVYEENGEFYLVGGFDSAMAHTMSFTTFIPAILVDKKPEGEYVKMKDNI